MICVLSSPSYTSLLVASSHSTMPKPYTSLYLEERACLSTSGAIQHAVPTPWVMVREPARVARAEPQSPILAFMLELLFALPPPRPGAEFENGGFGGFSDFDNGSFCCFSSLLLNLDSSDPLLLLPAESLPPFFAESLPLTLPSAPLLAPPPTPPTLPPFLDAHRSSALSFDLFLVSTSANVSCTKMLWLFRSRWMMGGSCAWR
mmetsp:Transcript_35754/g.86309  ORF Transcript_35754/g.86309 Transcript_35754/m.86309 type:complete len:204 (-) Transcript_35754:18-629(-)